MLKYVLISGPRAGAGLLNQCLLNHPACQAFGEILGWSRPGHVKDEQMRVFGCQPYERKENAAEFLRGWIFSAEKYEKDIQAVGFVLRYGQAREDIQTSSAWNYLRECRSIRIIHVVRENLLEQLVSLTHAIKTQSWYLKDRPDGRFQSIGPGGDQILEEKPQISPFEILPENADMFFTRTLANRAWVAQVFSDHLVLKVHYARLLSAFSQETGKVFDFMGLSRMNAKRAYAEPALKDPPYQISNYEELKEYFSSSIHSDFFDYC